MSQTSALRIRRSLHDVQADYEAGNKKPLEDLMRAWRGVKGLPPGDPRSFFVLGGYHGAPFRGAGWGNAAYWGGYCNHGNILFPTWHRIYLLKLEDALRSIPGCADVTLPFWDETNDESLNGGLPWALTAESFVLDGETIPNPLRSFVFSANVADNLNPIPDADYSKSKGYETVRYPLSGLVAPAYKAATDAHNALFPDHSKNVDLLNRNVVAWLTSEIVVKGQVIKTNVKHKYELSLDAPNYTVFSNTTSATNWRETVDPGVMSLESPHNSIHLAIGGFDLPGQGDYSPIPDANGDMGENDTAGFDPVFFFHHCFVDRVFWLWQQRHCWTDELEIIPQYPGTNSVDNQGPTPGTPPNSWLALESPLDPFKHGEKAGRPYTSLDCINIERQMNYTYGPGSLTQTPETKPALAESGASRTVRIYGINRALIRGSFLVSAFAVLDGKRYSLGTEAVLSRWSTEGCLNCQTHLETKAFFAMHNIDVDSSGTRIEVEVQTRDGLLGGSASLAVASALSTGAKQPFYFDVR